MAVTALLLENSILQCNDCIHHVALCRSDSHSTECDPVNCSLQAALPEMADMKLTRPQLSQLALPSMRVMR